MSTDTKPTLCPCGGSQYATCCEPFHLGLAQPSTAEALMRSRYSAYAKARALYLNETAATQADDVTVLENWCREVSWLRLQIWDTTDTTVRFTAHSLQQGQWVQLHETSEFVQTAGRWRYAQGRAQVEEAAFPLNARCPCGSGLKGKHCHGRALLR